MLKITIPSREYYDERNNEFVSTKEYTLQLEHSLVSISKWESKWCKPFLSKDVKTKEETLDYIRCMTITQNVDPSVYNNIGNDIIDQVNKYIEAPMTATWFTERGGGKKNGKQTTSERIYFWMISLNIPFDPCQKWHLNRLLTLIKVCDIEGQPSKKMSTRDVYSQNRALNNARKKRHNSKG